MGRMARHPSKRGKPGAASKGGSGNKGASFPGGPKSGSKPGPRHKAAQRPGWMPAPPPRPGGAVARSRAVEPHRDPHAAREAARYEQPIASREMILRILEANGPME